jgi:NADH dehydrogenase FAD-containing subunit
MAGYDGSFVRLNDGQLIPASTLIWTAGVRPSPVISPLPYQKQRDRLLVNEFLGVPGISGLWAVGDCAAVPNANGGTFHPPTAQHGLREGLVAARNIEAAIREIEQMITLRDAEALTSAVARIRARAAEYLPLNRETI